MDARYGTMVENALFSVVPREGSLAVAKVRPPIHEFIRRLLYSELNIQSASAVLKTVLKFDWNDKEMAAYIVKCLVNAWNLKYFNIKTLAWLVAELSRWDSYY